MSNIITGLDIGSKARIKAVVAEIKNNGRLLILGLKQPSAGFRKGSLVDFEEATVSLRNIISDLKSVARNQSKNVMLMLTAPISNLAFPKE